MPRKGEGVFNPFSVLNVFDGYKFSNYWFQTGTPTFLVELLKKSEYDLRTLIDGVEANASSFMEYRVDANNPIPLIYQSGYLTIKGYDKRFGNYLLKFPNDEVRYGFLIVPSIIILHFRLMASSISFSVKTLEKIWVSMGYLIGSFISSLLG